MLKFNCPVCNKLCRTKHTFDKHMNVHDTKCKVNYYTCPVLHCTVYFHRIDNYFVEFYKCSNVKFSLL